MKKNHLLYLIFGTIFWGFVIGAGVGFWNEEFDSFWESILFYILGTAFFTLVLQFYIGGFQTSSPKKWFFLPLASWVMLLMGQFII